MTATFIQTGATFPTDAGPVLTNDPAIDAGTLFLYDVLDTLTWPSQGAAVAGSTLVDLSETANATVSAGGMEWSSGFVFTSGDDARIVLPTSSDLAGTVTGYGITVWVEFTNIAGGNDSVLTMGKSGSAFNNTQYCIFTNLGDLKWNADGGVSTRVAVAGITTGVPHQIGYTVTLTSTTLTHTLWVDGVAVDTFTSTAPMADALTEAAAKIGYGDLFAGPPGMTFYRCNANDLSVSTAAQFIAADFAVGDGRF